MPIDYKTSVENLKQLEPDIISVAIIERGKELVYNTEDWDISEEVDKLVSIWDSMSGKSITIMGKKFSILQSTPERLIATSIKGEGHIIGAKDNERKLISHVKKEGNMLTAYIATARTLKLMSKVEPYISADAQTGAKREKRIPRYWDLPRLRGELMKGLIDFFKKGTELEKPDEFDSKRRKKERQLRMEELEKVLQALEITEEDVLNITIKAKFTTNYIYDDFHLLRIKHKIKNLLKEEFQLDDLELNIKKKL